MRSDAFTLKKIGARIRKIRTAKLIKQETLGKEVNLSKSEISRIENGKREVKIVKLMEIAKVIGVNINLLLED
jgi:transcriptional regulator with XRE-family HTH domain